MGVLLKSKASVSIVVVGAYFEAKVRLCRASLADGYGLSGSVVRNRSSVPKFNNKLFIDTTPTHAIYLSI